MAEVRLSWLTQDHGVRVADRCAYKKGNGPEECVCLGHLSTWLPGKVAAGGGLLLQWNVLGGHELSALHVEKQLLGLRGVFLMDTHAWAIFLTYTFSTLPAMGCEHMEFLLGRAALILSLSTPVLYSCSPWGISAQNHFKELQYYLWLLNMKLLGHSF